MSSSNNNNNYSSNSSHETKTVIEGDTKVIIDRNDVTISSKDGKPSELNDDGKRNIIINHRNRSTVFHKIYKYLNSRRFAVSLSFAYGFFITDSGGLFFQDSSFGTNALTEMFIRSFIGFGCAIGGEIIHHILPDNLKFVMPITLAGLLGHKGYMLLSN